MAETDEEKWPGEAVFRRRYKDFILSGVLLPEPLHDLVESIVERGFETMRADLGRLELAWRRAEHMTSQKE